MKIQSVVTGRKANVVNENTSIMEEIMLNIIFMRMYELMQNCMNAFQQ